MQRLKEHLKEAYKSFQDAKMETEHDPQNYTCLQIAEACYITLEKACYDVGVALTKEEKEEIKKPLIEKWQKIMEKDKKEWEIKEKFFNENVVPRVKSYGEAIEKAENIEATEEEIKAKAVEVAKMYSASEDEKMVDLLMQSQQAALRADVITNKTMKLLIENNK